MVRRLDDGTRVLLRPIRATDKLVLQQFVQRLSPESARARFLTPKDHLTGTELTYLTEVDGHDHVALVAVDADRPTRILAVARFIRDPEHPEAAEAAITVADEQQGRGLGRLIGHALADAAREADVRRFTATMLSDNTASLRVFVSLSERLDAPPITGPVREIVAQLAA